MEPIPSRELLKTGLAATLLTAVAAVAFFGVGFASGESIPFTHEGFGSDIWHQNLPFRSFYQDELRQGRLPHWCPNLGTGFPLLAEGQVGALYPPNLVLHALLPLPLAYDLSLLLTYVLAGAFAAMCAREVGAGRWPSMAAAIVFALSGFFVVHLKHANYIASAAWAPLVLLLVFRIAKGGGAGHVLALAAAFTLSILAGGPQLAHANYLLAGLATLVLAFSRRWLRGPLSLLAATALSLLIAAPQLLPSDELRRLGPRRERLPIEAATFWEMSPSHLLLFLSPFADGDPGELREADAVDPRTGEPIVDHRTGKPVRALYGFEKSPDHPMLFWEVTAYVGILPLLLSAAAVGLGWRRRPVLLLLLTLLLSILIALGRSGGLYVLLYRFVPGFGLFRMPSRFLFLADLSLALLSALGLTFLLKKVPRVRPAPLAAGLAVIVIFIDLFLSFGDHNPMRPAKDWLTLPETARVMKERAGSDPFRYISADPGRFVFRNAWRRARGWKGDLAPYEVAHETMDPNLGMLYGLSEPSLYTPIPLPWMRDILRIVYETRDPRTGLPRGLILAVGRLLNVRFYVDPFHRVPAGLPVLLEMPGDQLNQGSLLVPLGPPYRIRLLEDPGALPRAFLVPTARVVSEAPEREGRLTGAQQALLAPGFDPRREVLLTEGEPPPLPPPGGRSTPIEGGVSFAAYEPTSVRLRVESPRDAWLFLGDTWYPGWTATVDGVETRVHRANLYGRAVPVPPGRHDIEFAFVPRAFHRGLVAAGIGLLLCAAILIISRRFATRRHEKA